MKSLTVIAICGRCPRAKRLSVRVVACSIDGRDIRDHARERDCPESRFVGAGVSSIATRAPVLIAPAARCGNCEVDVVAEILGGPEEEL